MSAHAINIRIYYEDTDFSGNVYHAAYLKFFERARTEFLRDLDVHHSELAGQGLAFAVRAMTLDFQAAARIDDVLTVTTDVVEVTGARLVLDQTISREDRVVTKAQVTVVAIKMGGGATRLPAYLRARLRPGA
ncbi:tol-pal system-associated acyl-CoA thioesterase [Devosia sp. XK-2]|uniref:tol-pal system-associated acyl-CoA thioesterase n=1 Tax=Devosia sp. XK-2 TaxID=3126689 RepID=UPI0030CB452B